MSSFRLALIQLAVSSNKSLNLTRVAEKVATAAEHGAKIVCLPECFNSPYGTKYFAEYAEEVIDGPSSQVLKESAVKNKVYVIGGSYPEKDGNRLYNTCTVWSPEGKLVGKYRKMHLFDIDIPGKITFKESDCLFPGNSFSVVETPYCNIGLGICYDIRFAELAQIYARSCKLLVYPGAFNMTTGPLHWELLARGRALDNQVYVATVSPARDPNADYVAWGHSTLVDPFGKVVSQANHEEDIIYGEIDLDYVGQVRRQIPLQQQRRTDLYNLTNV